VGGSGEPPGALAGLFDAHRTTRGRWCTASCSTRRVFATGCRTGRNRSRLEALAEESGDPVGVAVRERGTPVAWVACGPRSRFRAAEAGRGALLAGLDRAEDHHVPQLPCFSVRPDRRGQGLPRVALNGALVAARRRGARAVEGWPVSEDRDPDPDPAFLGREATFLAAGFRVVSTPAPGRVLVRREL